MYRTYYKIYNDIMETAITYLEICYKGPKKGEIDTCFVVIPIRFLVRPIHLYGAYYKFIDSVK